MKSRAHKNRIPCQPPAFLSGVLTGLASPLFLLFGTLKPIPVPAQISLNSVWRNVGRTIRTEIDQKTAPAAAAKPRR